ncbi:hypothetical protein E6P09_02325 [Haloferax mediterranei ATCC 33500]|uniref:Uncharacterized protein n=1 Tax=Haloferax mediterranei (strain ATCC 33500 / DSM 1411 / JCM 8866 / NBRC 14739 / NCIMB 2177 / R-4) TaxID=523841 RepID=A0A4P8P0E5_HALMT|nr:hypothetical protein E6P09_02325 [Haloferax mediterranei ATCC 33500]
MVLKRSRTIRTRRDSRERKRVGSRRESERSERTRRDLNPFTDVPARSLRSLCGHATVRVQIPGAACSSQWAEHTLRGARENVRHKSGPDGI